MSILFLFSAVGIIAIFLIVQYEKQNRKKVDDILRANKNVPPLFMLRSAELKVNAIRSALITPGTRLSDDAELRLMYMQQLETLIHDYTCREIALNVYYSKLGALLISINELRGEPVEA